jgi:phosphoenolpyruvate synthase/pyruvate phosphate dikinase
MSNTFVYLPSKSNKVLTPQVGAYALELEKLSQKGVLIPKYAIVPQETLKIIGQANNLQAQVYKLLQEINYSSDVSKNTVCKKLQHLITKQSIPQKLAQELLSVYHNYFEKSFILVKNSEQLPFNDIFFENIHSDTNFVHAILELWAEVSIAQIKKLHVGTNSIHTILFPCPILVQEQLESKVSGTAYSFDLSNGSKNRITVLSSWGIFHDNQEDSDQFSVDVRTDNIISKNIKTKQFQFRRILGKLKSDKVLVKYQNQETLSSEQLKIIAGLVSKIKKNYLHQVRVNWAIQDSKVYVESILATEIQIQAHKPKTESLFKLYTTITSLNQLSQQNHENDGVAVYDSGRLLSASGTHPLEVVKTKQKKYLQEAISRTLLKYINKTNKPLIYRANNFTSKQYNKLQFSSLYEVPETNPFLGFRGGIRLISQPESFKLELNALSNVLNKTEHKVILLLPFVRSPDELAHLINLITKQGLTNHSNFEIYLELSTPENIFNLSEYPTKKIKGVIFNTQNIHALTTGIDPKNTDIASHYNLNISLIKKLVKTTIQTIKENSKTQSIDQKPQVFVDLTLYNKELLEQLCDLEINGFIINEQVTELAKKCIIEKQQDTIL